MSLNRALSTFALLLAAPLAQAGYFQWEMVELPPETGAACGDGSPYRFFVNRTPLSKDIVISYEGGGACWDQKACLGEGHLSAANPNGIPADYMQSANVAFGLVTPFTARNDPAQQVQTQSWNMVFLPYCTGDVHSGSKVAVYDDAYPATPRVEYHRGQANVTAAAQWLRSHLGQPAEDAAHRLFRGRRRLDRHLSAGARHPPADRQRHPARRFRAADAGAAQRHEHAVPVAAAAREDPRRLGPRRARRPGDALRRPAHRLRRQRPRLGERRPGPHLPRRPLRLHAVHPRHQLLGLQLREVLRRHRQRRQPGRLPRRPCSRAGGPTSPAGPRSSRPMRT